MSNTENMCLLSPTVSMIYISQYFQHNIYGDEMLENWNKLKSRISYNNGMYTSPAI